MHLALKVSAAKSDQNRSAVASAAATFAFGHLSNFDTLWWQNRWSDFDQISSQEWIIPLYLWFKFHPSLFSRFRDIGMSPDIRNTLYNIALLAH